MRVIGIVSGARHSQWQQIQQALCVNRSSVVLHRARTVVKVHHCMNFMNSHGPLIAENRPKRTESIERIVSLSTQLLFFWYSLFTGHRLCCFKELLKRITTTHRTVTVTVTDSYHKRDVHGHGHGCGHGQLSQAWRSRSRSRLWSRTVITSVTVMVMVTVVVTDSYHKRDGHGHGHGCGHGQLSQAWRSRLWSRTVITSVTVTVVVTDSYHKRDGHGCGHGQLSQAWPGKTQQIAIQKYNS